MVDTPTTDPAPAPAAPVSAAQTALYTAPGAPAQPAATTQPEPVVDPAPGADPIPAKADDPPAPEEPKVEETPAPTVELKLPDGFEVKAEVLDSFKQVLVDPALSPSERGQKLFDMYTQQLEELNNAGTKAWKDTQDAWTAELNSDPEIGGDKQPAVVQTVAKAIEKFGGDLAAQQAVREAFEVTGAGNNPAIARLVYRMAKALSEGTTVPATTPAVSRRRGAGALYGQTT